jgi:hypothetical protein
MADPISTTALTVFLFVAHVGENNGFPNTPNAAYVCGFDQAGYKLARAGDVEVLMVPGTAERFVASDVRIDNDAAGDYAQRQARISGRELSFYAANTKAQRVYFTVDVIDTLTGAVISCDPEIENEDPD